MQVRGVGAGARRLADARVRDLGDRLAVVRPDGRESCLWLAPSMDPSAPRPERPTAAPWAIGLGIIGTPATLSFDLALNVVRLPVGALALGALEGVLYLLWRLE